MHMCVAPVPLCVVWLLLLQNYGLAVGQLKDSGNILIKTTKLVINGWSSGFASNVSTRDGSSPLQHLRSSV